MGRHRSSYILNTNAPAPTDPPDNLTLPVITGTPQAGMTATTSRGTWTNSPFSFVYSWYLCDSGGASCVLISGETTENYLIRVGDVGSTIRSHVVAHNAIGDSSAAISDAFGPINSSPSGSWILASGNWEDTGEWDDTAVWID